MFDSVASKELLEPMTNNEVDKYFRANKRNSSELKQRDNRKFCYRMSGRVENSMSSEAVKDSCWDSSLHRRKSVRAAICQNKSRSDVWCGERFLRCSSIGKRRACG
jgi:hypothetical protein